jgi:putative selenate reductase
MSDLMIPANSEKLLNQILEEDKRYNNIFAVPLKGMTEFSGNETRIFEDICSVPVGPAAGPHTQLAQNIITAWIAGARFFELKTVQKMDSLEIPKPCIDARDECYNTEWSTELSLRDAFSEYARAWIILHLMKEVFYPDGGGDFIFNMSVGYDLNGIKTPKMQEFIDGMIKADTHPLWEGLKEEVKSFFSALDWEKYPRWKAAKEKIEKIPDDISPAITNSVTLSTMHGCPPQEIEAIASYLMREKELHTFVKLNPTLLGYEMVSGILKDLGFDYIELDPHSFEADLQFSDARPMLERLRKEADELGLQFGVKLSNTLAVKNRDDVLPGDEKYMSGRSLFPLTIRLAKLIADAFAGEIRISFSGGAAAGNIEDIYSCGIYPITVATDLLKPGGYLRLREMAGKLAGKKPVPDARIDLEKLNALVERSSVDTKYRLAEQMKLREVVKTPLELFDCYLAPCVEGCPINQDIPQYIELAGRGEYEKALEVIYDKNPLPNITGYICDHQCQFNCTRNDYEEPVEIREIKRIAAEKGAGWKKQFGRVENRYAQVAVIGAGPSGLAAAYFLKKAGFEVTVFEKESRAGGVVGNILPEFRIPGQALQADIDFIESFGVNFVFGIKAEDLSVDKLKAEGYKYIYWAIGAEKVTKLRITGKDINIIDALEFLRQKRENGENIYTGKAVAVIGGGNTAMDSARVALRGEGVEKVFLIYRRSSRELPADREEFDSAIADGALFLPLSQPVSHENGMLKLEKMKLGEPDDSGRRRPLPTGEFTEIPADLVVSAIGESVDTGVLVRGGLPLGGNGKVEVNPETLETGIENVFVGGDARTGPATVVEAIAEARKFADTVIEREEVEKPEKGIPYKEFRPDLENIVERRGKIVGNVPDVNDDARAKLQAERCLQCDLVCNKCVEVCPNRANYPVVSPGGLKNPFQIIHIDDFCNECGNCATFCPHDGKPYRDKFTLFSSGEMFIKSENPGIWLEGSGPNLKGELRYDSKVYKVSFDLTTLNLGFTGEKELPEADDRKNIANLVRTIYRDYAFLTSKAEI